MRQSSFKKKKTNKLGFLSMKQVCILEKFLPIWVFELVGLVTMHVRLLVGDNVRGDSIVTQKRSFTLCKTAQADIVIFVQIYNNLQR